MMKHECWLQYLRYFRPHRTLRCGLAAVGATQSFARIPLAAVQGRSFDLVLPAPDWTCSETEAAI